MIFKFELLEILGIKYISSHDKTLTNNKINQNLTNKYAVVKIFLILTKTFHHSIHPSHYLQHQNNEKTIKYNLKLMSRLFTFLFSSVLHVCTLYGKSNIPKYFWQTFKGWRREAGKRESSAYGSRTVFDFTLNSIIGY